MRGLAHRLFLVAVFAALIVFRFSPEVYAQQPTVGLSSISVTGLHGTVAPLTVWVYRPAASTSGSAMIIVMHGQYRNARKYCQEWIPVAEKYNCLLVCPEFDKAHYSDMAYNCGNIVGAGHALNPQLDWTFTTIDELFDRMRQLTGSNVASYFLYGHSAGGQFVHRFVQFMPGARYARAIAANPGWYTMPAFTEHKFPHGLRESGLTTGTLKSSLQRDFVLLLGEQDVAENDPGLNKSKKAEEQGRTRFERGRNYFNAALKQAGLLGAYFNWHIQTVPGVGHSDAKMLNTAAADFFGR